MPMVHHRCELYTNALHKGDTNTYDRIECPHQCWEPFKHEFLGLQSLGEEQKMRTGTGDQIFLNLLDSQSHLREDISHRDDKNAFPGFLLTRQG
jgi:hypothetical protein